MNKIINSLAKILVIAVLIFAACKKQESTSTNTAPNARAGNDSIIDLNVHSFLLDGSTSYDAENNIASYKWKLVSGVHVNITSPDSPKTQVENLVKGAYRFQLTVTDRNGLSSSDDVWILVTEMPMINYGNKLNDTTIRLPFNRALLKGVIQNYPGIKFSCAKISGPNSFSFQKPTLSTITYPNLVYTTVSNLVEGIYKFEVTASFSFPFYYQFPKDTITVTVLPDNNIYANEKLFDLNVWTCPWECTANIKNFTSIIPPGNPFKVYLKRNANVDWDIVFPSQSDSSINRYNLYEYAYSFEFNTLSIDTWSGGNYPFDPMIKIVY